MDPEFDAGQFDSAEPEDAQVVDDSFDPPAPGPAVEAPVTGDAAVDDAVAELARASTGPLEQQLPVLEAVHRTLQDRLADVEG